MTDGTNTTVVTAGDARFAWGTLLLVASMRRNGMPQPVVVGEMDWPEGMKRKVQALGHVRFKSLPRSRQCVTCQKPLVMGCEEVETEWVCWADSDGIFVGDCSEWLVGDDPDEITIRKCEPPPEDFTPENLAVWKRDVEAVCGAALEKSRYPTRVNAPFIVLHRKWKGFLGRWQRQIRAVLPDDVGIVMKRGEAYFQTDESVLGSLLCFDPDAPRVTESYKADGRVDRARHYGHFAYNPKPWVMWTERASIWREDVFALAEWLVEKGIVAPREVPPALRRGWWPLYRALVPAAPWVWRAKKAIRRLESASR